MTGTVRHPDPDEPWRFRCPGCGSACVHANVGGGVHKRPDDAAYRCGNPCGWRGEQVIDAKTQQLVDPSGKGGEETGPVPREASLS